MIRTNSGGEGNLNGLMALDFITGLRKSICLFFLL